MEMKVCEIKDQMATHEKLFRKVPQISRQEIFTQYLLSEFKKSNLCQIEVSLEIS